MTDGKPCAIKHEFRVLGVDEVGTMAVCQCGRWGVSTSTVERAEEIYATEHLAEFDKSTDEVDKSMNT